MSTGDNPLFPNVVMLYAAMDPVQEDWAKPFRDHRNTDNTNEISPIMIQQATCTPKVRVLTSGEIVVILSTPLSVNWFIYSVAGLLLHSGRSGSQDNAAIEILDAVGMFDAPA